MSTQTSERVWRIRQMEIRFDLQLRCIDEDGDFDLDDLVSHLGNAIDEYCEDNRLQPIRLGARVMEDSDEQSDEESAD